MPELRRDATFHPADSFPRIIEDLACPACGGEDPSIASRDVSNNTLRLFCDCCGAFVVFLLSDEQAAAIRAAA